MPAQHDPERDPTPASPRPRRDGSTASRTPPREFQQPLDLEATDASDEFASYKGAPTHIKSLEGLSDEALRQRAKSMGLDAQKRIPTRKLRIQILERLVASDGLRFAEGVLETLPEGFGFLRKGGRSYLPSAEDIYVSPSQIRRFGLKPGHTVHGGVRPPKPGERYAALLRIEAINERCPTDIGQCADFDTCTAIYPARRLFLETTPERTTARILDLLTPVGMGQRGLIVAPPRSGKTMILKELALAILENHPEAHVMVLLVDERPEEVTDFESTVPAEVISSTFDEPASRHVHVAELVIERARRLVETGTDVVILLDSITRLARAYNTESAHSGRVLSGGVDSTALQKPKQFFGSARALQSGASLTILATALIETGSRMDEVIFEEFKGTGNLEIVLDHRICERRIFPALDTHKSGTRREDLLLDPEELRRITALRRVLYDLNPVEAIDLLLQRMRRTRSNAELLLSLQV
ncbi:MAG TPA: transcription termination factor Rho [Planctomycetota bacterium]|jgi:transcription termination factor Rho|nr:transcription termination factor Rho [Planctomycetota bacterium]